MIAVTGGRALRRVSIAVLGAGLAAGLACNPDLRAAFTELLDARKLAAGMRVELHRSAAAAQLAVMADGDEAAAENARDAEAASQALERDLERLEPILTRLHYADEERLLQEFAKGFVELRELDRMLLALAVENSNAKAQRLAFGPASEAADAFRDRLADALRSAQGSETNRAELLAARAELAVRAIQALQAPHIAEAEDAVMSRLEERMAASETAARDALAELVKLLGPATRTALDSAQAELERFAELQKQILSLSRANTDVRSLAVALGRKRRVSAVCDAALEALQEALAKRSTRATR